MDRKIAEKIARMLSLIVDSPHFAVQALESFLGFAATQPQEAALLALVSKCRGAIPILTLAANVMKDEDVAAVIMGKMIGQATQAEEQYLATQPLTEERRSNAN